MHKGYKRFLAVLAALLCLCLVLAGCSGDSVQSSEAVQEQESQEQPRKDSDAEVEPETSGDPVTILVAAAASLEYSYVEELIPMFQAQYDWITVDGTYDSSGKLQTQIEEGLQADVFMSAAMIQMNNLLEQNLIDRGSVVELLENRIVLIAPSDSETDIASFEDVLGADTIALGDVESVPVGQYAQEAFTSLGIYDDVAAKTSFGTNVTEVLNWVAEGSADVGVVYATDAATTDRVKVIAQLPDGLITKVTYPVGVVAASENPEAAQLFVDFLQSSEALAVFQNYGFTPNV